MISAQGRHKVGSAWVLKIMRAVYGERFAEIGHRLLEHLTLGKLLADTGTPLNISRQELEEFRAVIDELERLSAPQQRR